MKKVLFGLFIWVGMSSCVVLNTQPVYSHYTPYYYNRPVVVTTVQRPVVVTTTTYRNVEVNRPSHCHCCCH